MADLDNNTSIYSAKVVNKLEVYEADRQHDKSYDMPIFQDTHLNSEIINYSNKSDAPIGLFDSGVGGLSVYKHLAQQLPSERYIYYADTKHVPYGNRESRDIENLTLNAIDWLYHQGCKLIVIACNSASAYALEIARYRYPQLPIVGLVPALKPAVLNSKSGKIAVLATKATLQGDLLNQVITEVATPRGYTVTKYFDPYLVPWVEAGMPENSETAERLKQMLKYFCAEGIDYLVLGCTHYPFFREFLLKQITDNHFPMQVVDSGQAIAARVQHLLVTNKIMALDRRDDFIQPLTFYASKYDSQLMDMLPRLLGAKTTIHYEF
ncbi:glutamate racemase [Psychrobacter sp. M13]|uniref:glutamate racemase n=1 Tax=Psychrobacter sp. M13 TaxID=3067275 RepID=UPI00273B6339|nr:glutamate racemase [Psychrobacter sp. M13]WLP94288.1 glutamate racemase [Psychrobacter sp. M13]